jgi:hypothetical protein
MKFAERTSSAVEGPPFICARTDNSGNSHCSQSSRHPGFWDELALLRMTIVMADVEGPEYR